MDISLLPTLVLALLQGVTELFPISSLGHTVIIPALLGWGDLETNENFLPMIVAFHLGTCIALLAYFWRDWLQVGKTVVTIAQTRQLRKGTEEWVSWLVVLGTIPAGLLGLALQNPLEKLFSAPTLIAAFLILNGSVLFVSEAMRRKTETQMKSMTAKEREAHFRPLTSLSWKEAMVVGLAQSLALIPGFSRSGMTMVAGLGVRMSHEDSARFSFLLGTPIILAAAVLKVPKLFHLPSGELLLVILGVVISGVAAYLSTKFLMKYFETGRLDPFAYYCWGGGLLYLIVLLTLVR